MKVIIRKKGQAAASPRRDETKSIEQKLRAEICVWRRERTFNVDQMRQTIWA